MKRVALLILTLFISSCDNDKPMPSTDSDGIAGIVAGSLVDRNNKSVTTPDTPYYLIYFSAHWCPPCRAFTPILASFNNSHRGNDNFQTIFVSGDKGQSEMLDYMQSMPWPAVKYRGIAAGKLRKYAGGGIPDLEVIDRTGKVIFSSFKGSKYIGPNAALRQFEQLLTTLPKPKTQNIKFSPKSSQEIQAYTLSGVAGGEPNRKAIINGDIFSIGDEVSFGVVLEAVTDKSAVLSHNGKMITLTM